MNPLIVVGAGRLAATLLRDLAALGAPLQWWARPSPRRDAVQQWLAQQPGAAALAPTALSDARSAAEATLILVVSDAQVAAVARQLAAQRLQAAALLHCAGALPVEPLRVGLAAACGSCHPLAAVADPLLLRPAASPLRGALFALDGDALAQQRGAALAQLLGGHSAAVSAEQRGAYHAAAALIANDWVALADSALQTARRAGLPEAAMRPGLLHLAETALRALQALPSDQPLLRGLTGAVARGDAETLGRHLQAIDDAAVRQLHRQASLLLMQRCQATGQLSADAAQRLGAVIGDEPARP